MSISRLYDFTPNTTILSAQVDGEFDQLVAEVNKMFKKDCSEDLTGDLTIAKSNPAYIFDGLETSAKGIRLRSDGGFLDFDIYDGSWTTIQNIDVLGVHIKVGGLFVDAGKIEMASGLPINAATGTDLLLDQTNEGVYFGDGTSTTEELVSIRANTGDATLALVVNNAAANTWKILNDNSDSDKLKFRYNDITHFQIDPSNGRLYLSDGTHSIYLIPGTSSRLGIYDGSNYLYIEPGNIGSSTPAADTVYADMFCQGRCDLACGTGGTVSVSVDFNISSASYSSDDLTVNIDKNLPSNGFTVAWSRRSFGVIETVMITGRDVDAFVLNSYPRIWADGDDSQIAIFGDM